MTLRMPLFFKIRILCGLCAFSVVSVYFIIHILHRPIYVYHEEHEGRGEISVLINAQVFYKQLILTLIVSLTKTSVLF